MEVSAVDLELNENFGGTIPWAVVYSGLGS